MSFPSRATPARAVFLTFLGVDLIATWWHFVITRCRTTARKPIYQGAGDG